MSEKEWARLYTDEQYFSKSEVQSAMRTSLIDGYWNDIVEYRAKYQVLLPFRTITNRQFFYTYDDAIRTRITSFEMKADRFIQTIKRIMDLKEEGQAKRLCLLSSLKAISIIENTQMSELSLKALLNGTYQENNPFHKPVIDYFTSLKYYLDNANGLKVDEDFLGEALSKCLSSGELTSFYRNFDFDNSAEKARYMYNPDYEFAPNAFIETLMGEFLSWLNSSQEAYFIKAVFTLYYFDYVKPFEKANIEVASLASKALYSKGDMGKEAFLLPLEQLFVKTPKLRQYTLEAQRSGDLTYLLFYCLGILDPLIESLNEGVKTIKIDTYRPEFHQISEEERRLSEKKPDEVQIDLFAATSESSESPSEKNEEPAFVKPIAKEPPLFENNEEAPSPEPEKTEEEEAKPAEEAPVERSEPVKETEPVEQAPAPMESSQERDVAPETETPKVKEASKTQKVKIITTEEMEANSSAERSIELPENQFNDKEIKEYIQYLLETNPNLNKNQASFLANHCTVGRYYSIQQFKKFTRCAYETARTSMDKLAAEHYYNKLQVKNKFVYTPVRKGDNQ